MCGNIIVFKNKLHTKKHFPDRRGFDMAAPHRTREATSVMSFLDLMRLDEHQQRHFHTSGCVLHFINSMYVNREYSIMFYNLSNTLVMLKFYNDFKITLLTSGSLPYINMILENIRFWALKQTFFGLVFSKSGILRLL